MSPRFVLGRENVPCVAEVVNRSLKADCTDFSNCYDYEMCCFKRKMSAPKRLIDSKAQWPLSFLLEILSP